MRARGEQLGSELVLIAEQNKPALAKQVEATELMYMGMLHAGMVAVIGLLIFRSGVLRDGDPVSATRSRGWRTGYRATERSREQVQAEQYAAALRAVDQERPRWSCAPCSRLQTPGAADAAGPERGSGQQPAAAPSGMIAEKLRHAGVPRTGLRSSVIETPLIPRGIRLGSRFLHAGAATMPTCRTCCGNRRDGGALDG